MLTLTTVEGTQRRLGREQRERLAWLALSSIQAVAFPEPFREDPLEGEPARTCRAQPGLEADDQPVEDPELHLSEDGEATEAWLLGLHLRIEPTRVTFEPAGEFGLAELPTECDAALVDLLLDLTGWHFDAAASDPEELEWIAHELAREPASPAPAASSAESARRLLGTLIASGAVRLRPGAPAEPVLALLSRQLEAPRPTGADLAAALLACPEVEELFASDEALGQLLAAW